jgi:opacity protein-like surface antigen
MRKAGSFLLLATLVAVGSLLVFPGAARAQEPLWHEVSLQGTGFFTKDSQGRGISQHATDSGGFLLGYRYHFNRWIAAEANYGYVRNTQRSVTSAGAFNIQANVHEATAAVVVTPPVSVVRLRPYVLAGSGALVFDPTGNPGGLVSGAQRQAKPVFVYGGGADYEIMKHISLRAEYRGLVYKRPDFELSNLNSDVVAHTAQPSAGIVFRF